MVDWTRTRSALLLGGFRFGPVITDVKREDNRDTDESSEDCNEDNFDTMVGVYDPVHGAERVVGASLSRTDGGAFKLTVYDKGGLPVYCERLERLNIEIQEAELPTKT